MDATRGKRIRLRVPAPWNGEGTLTPPIWFTWRRARKALFCTSCQRHGAIERGTLYAADNNGGHVCMPCVDRSVEVVMAVEPASASVTYRGVTATVTIDDSHEDNPREVTIQLTIDPEPPGLDRVAYTRGQRAPETKP